MASVFCDAEGIIMVDYLEKGVTITGSYAEQIITLFHKDNALAHNATVALATVQEAGFELVEHPPYSPDLAPSDFFLFSRLKEHLLRKKFFYDSDVIIAVEDFFESPDQ